MPRCFGCSGSVRATSIPRSAVTAPDVHTFCPLTIQTSPSRTARVDELARSLPAPGSLNSWHHDSAPAARFRTHPPLVLLLVGGMVEDHRRTHDLAETERRGDGADLAERGLHLAVLVRRGAEA